MSTSLSSTTPAAPGGNTNVTWQADGQGHISGYVPSSGGTPGGLNTQVQYNNAGSFGGAAGLTWNSGSSLLTIPNAAITGTLADGSASVGTSGQVLSSTVTGVAWVTRVSSFSAGNLSPVFTTSVATATSTPALTFTLNTQTAATFFAGPLTGSPATPTFRAIAATDFNGGSGASGSTFLTGNMTWGTPGAGTGLANDTTATVTETSLAAGATDSSQTVTMFKSFNIRSISMSPNVAVRIRLYSTSAARAADLSRPYSTPLLLGSQHECICDFYFDQVNSSTPWTCSPIITGMNADVSLGASIYASITNMTTSVQTFTVTFNIVQLEN